MRLVLGPKYKYYMEFKEKASVLTEEQINEYYILLLLLIGGCLMISLGIIGLYIAKIYDEVKGRPRFIISESTENK